MKNKILTLLFISFLGHAQQYKSIDKLKYRCEYLLRYQPDSTDVKSRMTESMLLLVGDSVSVFYSKNEYLKDSIYIANKIWTLAASDKIAVSGATPKAALKYKIIKNQVSQKTSLNEKILMDTFQYEEPSNQLKWEILDSMKVILGYNCQKASTNFAGRSYEAWFSSELPINDGPYKFNGLPGLILQIYDSKRHYQFQMMGFKATQYGEIFVSKAKVFKVNKVVFNEKKLDNEMNPFKTLSQNPSATMTFSAGGSEMSAQEMDKLVQIEQKKKNNPIELK